MITNPLISIEVKNVHKKLKDNIALDGISLEFDASKLHGIIGPVGAGKTTLLRTILGLLKPDSGEVTFLQNNKMLHIQDVRNKLGYMPEKQSLYPELTISEHLLFFKRLYQLKDDEYQARVTELLNITRLQSFTDRKARDLSGGMYKKLGLMCALLRTPEIIILDEPTNGVDPISRREFWDLLYRFLDQKILILVATAYMDEAERCSRVHLLEKGKVILSGEPREILAKEHVDNFEMLYLKSGELTHE